MANGETERVGRWTRVKEIPGGQVAYCRLCGKWSKRSYMAANTNYAEALKRATEYAEQHMLSAAHRAALDAYFADEVPQTRSTKEEAILRELFNTPVLTEQQLRRQAARRAAEAVVREAEKAEQRARSAAGQAT